MLESPTPELAPECGRAIGFIAVIPEYERLANPTP